MSESYSVKARLSAIDSGFSSVMNGALGSINSLADRIKSGFAFGVLAGAGQQAFSLISSGVKSLAGEAVSTSDSMYKLQAAMRFSGTSESEISRIAGATGTLKTYADKTVFSLEDVLSTFGALSANGIKDADKMTESVGNAVAVFGGGAQEFSSVGLAYSQAMAAGSLHAQDWNQILNASPQLAGGLKKELIKLNPVLGEDFKGAMEDGAISADLLGQAMNNIGMDEAAKKAATSVSTMEGAMGNLQATVVSGMMDLYDGFAKSGAISAINSFNDKLGGVFDKLSTSIPAAIDKIKPYWESFKDAFKDVGPALGDAFRAVKESLAELNGDFGSTESVDKFKSTMLGVADAIKKVAGFISEHADTFAKLIKWLPAIVVGVKGFGVVKSVLPGVVGFTQGIAGLASKGIGGIAGKLFGISSAQSKVGATSQQSGSQMLSAAKSYALMGVAVLAISLGFALLAYSAIQLAAAGPLAIGVMAGLVVAVAGLMIGIGIMLKTLAPMSGQLVAVGVAFLAMGAAVLLISVGFAIMAQSAIALAAAGWPAIAVMIGLVAVMALLAVGAAVLGGALTGGAVGFIAFGAAILLCGVGAILAATALVILSSVLPVIVAYGLRGSVAILALGAALLIFGAGALVAGAGAAVLGAGLLIVGVAVLVIAAGFLVIGAAALLTASALLIVSKVLPMLAENGLQSSVALIALGAALIVFGAGAAVAGAACLILGAGLSLCAVAFTVLSVGTILTVAALALLTSLFPVIAQYGLKTSLAITALGASFVIFAAGAGLAGVSAALLGAGMIIAGAAVIVLSAGLLVLSAGALIAAAAVMLICACVPMLVSSGASAAGALALLSAGMLAFSAGAVAAGAACIVLGAGMIILGAGIVVAAAGAVIFGAGMTIAAAGVLIMSAALSLVSSSMRSIAKKASDAEKSLDSMQDSVSIVESGLSSLGSMAESAMRSLINAFSGAAGDVKSSGKEVGTGFAVGLQSGIKPAQSIAIINVGLVISVLMSAKSGAYNAGAYISIGFAKGMLSQMSTIRNAATQMAEAADEAVRAKARIASPSKVTTELGRYFGEGFANGIADSARDVWNAAKSIVAIPAVATPELSLAYAGELSEDYNFSRNGEYRIEVPVSVDGKEIALATATYMQDELDKRQTRINRKHGRV